MLPEQVRRYLVFLYPSGAHPEKAGSNLHRLLFFWIVLLHVTNISLNILFLAYEENLKLSDVVSSLEAAFLISHGMIKLISFYLQRPKVTELLRKLQLFRKIDDVDDPEVKASCLRTVRTMKTISLLFGFGSIISASSFVIFPVYKGTPIFIIYAPAGIPYAVKTFLQAYEMMLGISFPVLAVDFLYVNVVYLLKVQFKILNHNIKRMFPLEASEEGEATVRGRVKEWVDYHNFLLEFVKSLNEIYSSMIFLYIGTVVFSMCVELYITSLETYDDTFKCYMYILMVFFEFIGNYCIPTQAMSDEADKTKDILWNSSWYHYSPSSTKVAMTMILMKTQKPVSVMGGIMNISMQTCLATIKTIMSYYMFLRTMAEKGQKV